MVFAVAVVGHMPLASPVLGLLEVVILVRKALRLLRRLAQQTLEAVVAPAPYKPLVLLAALALSASGGLNKENKNAIRTHQ